MCLCGQHYNYCTLATALNWIVGHHKDAFVTESHHFRNERFWYRGYTSGVYLASVDLDDKPSAKH
jgi:hypothetical protein